MRGGWPRLGSESVQRHDAQRQFRGAREWKKDLSGLGWGVRSLRDHFDCDKLAVRLIFAEYRAVGADLISRQRRAFDDVIDCNQE